MRYLLQDVRFALRLLAKSPWLTASGVLMLAVGIGMNSAIFSFVEGLLLRPLALPEMGGLVSLWEYNPLQRVGRCDVSPANFRDWEEQCRRLDHLSAYEWWETNIEDAGGAEHAQGFRVTPGFFGALRVGPALGRTIDGGDAQPGRDDVAVISYGLWQRRFVGDRGAVGKRLTLDGRSYRVIGVMPRDFEYPITSELWVPLVIAGELSSERGRRYLQVLGRLRPGAAKEPAQAELRAVAARAAEAHPDTDGGWAADLALMRDRVVTDSGTASPILILAVAAGFVWLLACANVANLQLASATGRRKEMAIRTAIGANPRRLVSQLLIESLVVGVMAGVASLVFAVACLRGLKASLPEDMARYLTGWKEIGLDGWALAFTLVAALVTGMLSGIFPALMTGRTDPNAVLKESARGSTVGRGHRWIRLSLVVVEVTLSLVLLTCTGLLLGSFLSVMHAWRGFTTGNVLTFDIALPPARYPSGPQAAAFYERAAAELAAAPGVRSVAMGSHLPFAHVGWDQRPFQVDGIPDPKGKERRSVVESVSPGFFQTLGIPLRAGRFFSPADGAGSPMVAVVSESLARRCWTNRIAGGRLQLMGEKGEWGPVIAVVGVAGDARHDWEKPNLDAIYVPLAQVPPQKVICALKTEGAPTAEIATARAVIRRVDPLQPVTQAKPWDQIMSNSLVGYRLPALMLSMLSVLALLLAGAGVFSLLAHTFGQRTQEIGIRMALGAQRSDILRMVLLAALRLVVAGMLVGLPASLACGRVLGSLMYGVGSLPLQAIAGASALLVITALAAALLPARQAVSVDPAIVLREE